MCKAIYCTFFITAKKKKTEATLLSISTKMVKKIMEHQRDEILCDH